MFNKLKTTSRIIKKILAILLVINFSFTNFALIGNELISYALEVNINNQNNETNSANVKFDVYLESNNKDVKQISKDINNEDAKLYVAVSVQGGGYLTNGKVVLEDTNFVLKENEKQTEIRLDTIQSEKGITIELPIKAKKTEEFDLALLNMISKIKLIAKYKNNEGNEIDIDSTKGVQINWNTEGVTEDNNPIELEKKLIANRVYKIEGEEKVVIQEEIISGITNNAYPIKSTQIEINVPTLGETKEYPEKVIVASYGTIATNGKNSAEFGVVEEQKEGQWLYNEEEHKIIIKVENLSQENIVSWLKEGKDKFIVTYIYNEKVQTTNYESRVNSKLELYGDSNTILTKQINSAKDKIDTKGNAIELKPSASDKIYKGNMNIGEETEFETTWEIGVGISDIANKNVCIGNSEENLLLSNNENNKLQAETYYKSTKINKTQLLKILGEEGNLYLINENNPEEVITINKDSKEDENGNICINYEGNKITQLLITMTKPVSEGNLAIIHTKMLKTSNLEQEQIENLNKLETNAVLFVDLPEEETKEAVIESIKNTEIILENTTTEVAIAIDKSNLSTTQNNNINITATLKTDDIKYSLYKNPIVQIELPEEVEKAEIKSINILNGNGLQIKSSEVVVNENGNKAINVKIEGEQLQYIGQNVQITINANIQTTKLIPTLEREIVIKCTNKKETSESRAKITFVAEQGILLANSIDGYNNDEPELIAFKNETKTGLLKAELNELVTATVKGTIINNTESDLEQIKIRAKINQTEGLNAKIKAETLEIEKIEKGQIIEYTYKIEIPANIGANKTIETNYVLEMGESIVKSPVIVLETERKEDIVQDDSEDPIVNEDENPEEVNKVFEIKTELLKNYDNMVINGRVIYLLSVKNVSEKTIDNLTIENIMPKELEYYDIRASKENIEIESNEEKYTFKEISLEKDEELVIRISAYVVNYNENGLKNEFNLKWTEGEENKEYTQKYTDEKEMVKPEELAIELTSNKEGKEIKENEEIQYVATIQNKGQKDVNTKVNIKLSEELGIFGIECLNSNKEQVLKSETSNIEQEYIDIYLQAGETITINILAKLVKSPKELETDTIVSCQVEAIRGELVEKSNVIENIVRKEETITPTPSPDPTVKPTETPVEPTPEPTPNQTPDSTPNPEPSPEKQTYKISGIAWLDDNQNGEQEGNEKLLKGIIAKIKNVETGNYLKDKLGQDLKVITDNNGKYEFTDLEAGKYVIEYEYNKNTYRLTPVSAKQSKANTVTTEEGTKIITDTIAITNENVENINIGLVLNPEYDLELNKYITKVTVKNGQGTKVYTYNKEQLAKVDIKAKYLSGSTVIVEYAIDVTNKGAVPGYAKTIVDYLSPELKFSSELNTNWYQGTDNNLYCLELAGDEIAPGETKQVKLVLTKTMTNNNTGLVNNTAEIYEDFNEYALEDSNSTPGNKEEKENDMSTADIIITISTGSPVMYIGIVIASMAVLGLGIYLINKKVIMRKII